MRNLLTWTRNLLKTEFTVFFVVCFCLEENAYLLAFIMAWIDFVFCDHQPKETTGHNFAETSDRRDFLSDVRCSFHGATHTHTPLTVRSPLDARANCRGRSAQHNAM